MKNDANKILYYLTTWICISIAMIVFLNGCFIKQVHDDVSEKIHNAIESSTPYKQSMSEASINEKVQRSLGLPIEASSSISKTNISENDLTGKVDMVIPLQGPKGKGTLHVVGTKSEGKWDYSIMEVKISKTGNVINLLLQTHVTDENSKR